MTDRAAATAIAEQITSACVEAILDWGEAANAADAAPSDEHKKALARAIGLRALELAMGLAKRLRPARRT
jgi:hypothetical protein